MNPTLTQNADIVAEKDPYYKSYFTPATGIRNGPKTEKNSEE